MRLVGVGLSLWGPQTTEQLGLRFGQLGLNVLSCERIEYPTWAFFGEAPTNSDTSMPLDQAATLCIGQIVSAVERLTPAEREWLAECRFRKLQIGVTFLADIAHSARLDIDPNLSQRLAAAGIEPQIRTFPEPLDNIDAMNMPQAWAKRIRRV